MNHQLEESHSPPTGDLRLGSATSLIIAVVIGVGIFTSTGFQAASLGHPMYILALWFLGGLLAFCGALCYAELGAAMPYAGGEYVYLRESYGYTIAFMSGFVSLIAGFSAPIAAVLKSWVRYLGHFFPSLVEDSPYWGVVHINDWIAVGLVWILVAIHLLGIRSGTRFNDLITLFKVASIVGILVAAAWFGKGDVAHLLYVSERYQELRLPDLFGAMANSLIFIMFCYSGWNASAYIASEIKNPKKLLPTSLLAGTGIVMLLYIGLNVTYFYGANVDELANQVEVGLVAARHLFGPRGVTAVSVSLLVCLLSAASAMTVAGPRVYYALGCDFPAFRWLSRTSAKHHGPMNALVLQGVVTSVIILSGRVDQIQQYVGFTITLFSCLAVSSVIVLRIRKPNLERPFRTWGYPVTPLLFLTVSIWTLIWNFRGRPAESTLALLTVALAGLIFYLTRKRG